jgi:mono/diheme cytochrome c family protein
VIGTRKIEMALICGIAIFSYAAARANAQSAAGADAQKKASAANAEVSAKRDEAAEGEKRFQANCGRCHVAPDDLNPRVVKAVVRQMRVRALLTEEDERLIVKYLAP